MPHPPFAKLLFYTDSTYFSGAERSFALLMQQCQQHGIESMSLVTKAVETEFNTVSTHRCLPHASRSKVSLFILLRHILLLKKFQPNVAIVNMWSPYANTLFLLAAKITGTPTATIYHYYQKREMVTGLFKVLKLIAYRIAEKLSDHIFTVSEAHKEILISDFDYPQSKVSVLLNGSPIPKTQSKLETSMPRKLLAVGSLEPAKGYHFLISCLKKADFPFLLTIVGDGPSRQELEKLSEGNKNIKFLGKLSDLDTVYKNHDVLVHPSHFENLSMAIIEAMSYGLAILANDVGGNRELVRNGKEGWLLSLHSESEWGKALHKACTEDVIDYQQSSMRHFRSQFTVEHQYESFIKQLHHALNTK